MLLVGVAVQREELGLEGTGGGDGVVMSRVSLNSVVKLSEDTLLSGFHPILAT